MHPKSASTALLALSALTLALSAGCRVENDKSGGSDNVKIATPFGGMSVKTDENVVEGGVGLAVYPGATLVKKEGKGNDGAADINMSFGSFHLGVKALNYHTADAPDKVTAFYRKDMARYGAVILCQHHHSIGSPDHTQDGLTCDDDNNNHNHININDDDAKDELKAGSKLHQHIVSIDPDGNGTKIGLVALDLPGNFKVGDDDNSKQ